MPSLLFWLKPEDNHYQTVLMTIKRKGIVKAKWGDTKEEPLIDFIDLDYLHQIFL